MPDRFDRLNINAGRISAGLHEAGAYTTDLDAIVAEAERSLRVATHQKELPESLHLRLVDLKKRIVDVRDSILLKMQIVGDDIKREETVGDALLHEYGDIGTRIVSLAERLNPALDRIDQELLKPIAVVEEGKEP